MERKEIKVVAAVIRKGDKILATQRGYGDYKDWWEFPGGKLEDEETPEEALVREIKEELNTTIALDKLLTTVEYDYPEFHLSMDCFWCHIAEGEPTLLEHEAAKWLPIDELRQVQWLPADILAIEEIEKERLEPLRKKTVKICTMTVITGILACIVPVIILKGMIEYSLNTNAVLPRSYLASGIIAAAIMAAVVILCALGVAGKLKKWREAKRSMGYRKEPEE